ncbi:MAG: PAS domain S-box protein [Bacteroidetes bacterium]|nr:PAS domain S-box protein [Bacteroidota bacterium]
MSNIGKIGRVSSYLKHPLFRELFENHTSLMLVLEEATMTIAALNGAALTFFTNRQLPNPMGQSFISWFQEKDREGIHQFFQGHRREEGQIWRGPIFPASGFSAEAGFVSQKFTFDDLGLWLVTLLEITPLTYAGESDWVVSDVDYGLLNNHVKSESLFQQFFRSTHALSFITDLSGEIIETNDSFDRILGLPKAQIKNKKIRELVEEDDISLVDGVYSGLQKEKTIDSEVIRLVDESGKQWFIEWHPVFQGDRVFSTAYDIHKRIDAQQKMNEAVAENGRFMRRLLHLMNEVLLFNDNHQLMPYFLKNVAMLFDADESLFSFAAEDAGQQKVYDQDGKSYFFDATRANPGVVNFTLNLLEDDQLVMLDDVATSDFAQSPEVKAFNMASLIGVPILVNEQKWGALIIGYNKPTSFSLTTINHAQFVARIVSVILGKNAYLSDLDNEKSILTSLLNSMPEIVFYKDLDRRYVGANPATEKLLGINLEKAYGKTNRDLFGVERSRFFDEKDNEVVEKKAPLVYEASLPLQDGSEMPVETLIAPWYSIKGDMIGMIGLSRDISTRKRLEKTIRDNDLLLRQLTDNIPGMIAIVALYPDKSLGVTYMSVGVEQLFHLTAEEAMNDGFLLSNTLHPDDKLRAFSALKKSLASLSDWTDEFRVRTKTGGWRWVKAQGKSVRTPDGIVLCYNHVMDITEKIDLEMKLKASEANFKSVYNNAAIGLYRTTPDGKVVMANPSLVNILGYDSVEEIHNLNLEDEKVALTYERNQFLFKMKHDGAVQGFETSWVKKNGDRIFVRENATTTKNSQGEIVYFEGSIEDITVAKMAQEALAASEEKFRQLAENIDAVIWLRSADHKTLKYVNPAFSAVTGYSVTQAYRYPDWFFNRIPKEDYPAFIEKHNLFLHDKNLNAFDTEFRIQTKNRKTIWVRYKVMKYYNTEGVLTGYIALISDISRLKKAENSLRETLNLEKQLNSLKSRLVSMASHEFKTPLATVQAVTETLLGYREQMSEDQLNSRLSKILKQVSHLREITSNVLDLAKINEGKLVFTPIRTDFMPFIIEVIEDIQHHPKYAHIIHFSPKVKTLPCFFDPGLMRRVFINLLTNAVSYSPTGSAIALEVRRLKNSVVVSVEDHGLGMSKATLEHVFEAFYRGENVTGISGTGLGMAMVKEAVDRHRGTVSIKSKLNKGTTVSIMLPCS